MPPLPFACRSRMRLRLIAAIAASALEITISSNADSNNATSPMYWLGSKVGPGGLRLLSAGGRRCAPLACRRTDH